MANENDFRGELLKQAGIVNGSLPEKERDEMKHLIEQDKKRIRRLKWAVGISLGGAALLGVLGVLLGSFSSGKDLMSKLGPGFAAGGQVLLYIAALLAISLYVRWRIASTRQLHASLRAISEQLEKLAHNSRSQQDQRADTK